MKQLNYNLRDFATDEVLSKKLFDAQWDILQTIRKSGEFTAAQIGDFNDMSGNTGIVASFFAANPDVSVFYCMHAVCKKGGYRRGHDKYFQCFARNGEVSPFLTSMKAVREWLPKDHSWMADEYQIADCTHR